MTAEEFTLLLERGESSILEYKAILPQNLADRTDRDRQFKARGTLMKDLQALANAPGDGVRHLVYGIKDQLDHRVRIGIDEAFDDADVQDWVANALEPAPRFVSNTVMLEGKRFLVFTLHPLNISERPHVARVTMGQLHQGQVWYRRGTQNVLADRATLKALFTDTGVQIDVCFAARSREPNGHTLHVQAEQEAGERALEETYRSQLEFLSDQVERFWQAEEQQKQFQMPKNAVDKHLDRMARIEQLKRPGISMVLTDQEQSTIQFALKHFKIELPWSLLNTPEAYGPLQVPAIGYRQTRESSDGRQKDRRNALEQLFTLASQLQTEHQALKETHWSNHTRVLVRNMGETPLENLTLTLSVTIDGAGLESNDEGRGYRRTAFSAESPADPRRMRVEGRTAAVSWPLLAAGQDEIFFGSSVRRSSSQTRVVPVAWSVSARNLRQPITGTLWVEFEPESATELNAHRR